MMVRANALITMGSLVAMAWACHPQPDARAPADQAPTPVGTAPADVELPIAASRIGTVVAEGPALILDGEALSRSDGLGYSH